MTKSDREHLDRIQDRFTRTAEVFSSFVMSRRAGEGERLARMLTSGWVAASEARVLDVACGPGTFTLPVAARVRQALGLDFTGAMIERAQAEAARAGRSNAHFLRGNVYALPFSSGALDAVLCGYCFHHFQEPDRALAEMVRVTRPGGRVGLVDLIVPFTENVLGELRGGKADRCNAIERLRDPSHASTLSAIQLRTMFAAAGLRVVAEEDCESVRSFEEWMRVAGFAEGSDTFRAVETEMEKTIAGDAAGFHPRRAESGALEFTQTTIFLVAEKAR
jgi:ubiquinone/menaquinone biosynthesis C-methylase UbiE